MKKIVTITIAMSLLLLVVASGGCESDAQRKAREEKEAREAMEAIEVRGKEIRVLATSIKKGDTEDPVKKILGQPDERTVHSNYITLYWKAPAALGFSLTLNKSLNQYTVSQGGYVDPLDPRSEDDGFVWLIKP